MRKIFCMALALLMAFSMAACQSKTTETTPPTEKVTETTTEATTQATIPEEELNRFKVDESLAKDSKTVTFDTPREYEDALHEMGYIEFQGDVYRPSSGMGVVFMPISLTYNEEAFRLDFDYKDASEIVKGWILYGTLNAAKAENISSHYKGEYDWLTDMDFSTLPDSIFEAGFVHAINNDFLNFINDEPVCCLSNAVRYYPDTGNLYNLVYEYKDNTRKNYIAYPPRVLCETADMLGSPGYNYGDEIIVEDEAFQDELDYHDLEMGYMTLVYGPGDDITLNFDVGMTLADWVDSKYNTEGWILGDNNTIRLPAKNIHIENADVDIYELGPVEEYIVTIYAVKD